jgi:hypothetical protein
MKPKILAVIPLAALGPAAVLGSAAAAAIGVGFFLREIAR